MSTMASQITRLTIVHSSIYSGADQRTHQSSASIAFVRGNSPVTGEFPAQKASNVENDFIWWRHHGVSNKGLGGPPLTPSPCLPDCLFSLRMLSLRWRHNDHHGVSNHQPHHCLLNCLFGHRSKKTSKLCVTGLCVGNSTGTGEFPAQMASNAENVSLWWRHHDTEIVRTNSGHQPYWNNMFTYHVYKRLASNSKQSRF